MEFVSVDGTVVDAVTMSLPAGVVSPHQVEPQPEPPRPSAQPGPPAVQVREPYRSASGRAAVIVRLYLAVFQREPDRAGFDYWTGLAAPTAAVADYFANSPEFEARYGALSDDRFVERVYQNVMGRASDRAGLEYWTTILRSGVDRGAVMLGFSESPEFRLRSGVRG